MGLLDQTQQDYYQGNDHGNYQFTSLDDVINQFIVAYVGEDKIISKVKRVDVAFHAQRALAELSFDTLKSCKAQEIVVPASLQLALPQDYVNYTKVSWVDSAGIKHIIYPTSSTSNPSLSAGTAISGSQNVTSITTVGAQSNGGTTLAMEAVYTGIQIGMLITGVVGIPAGAVVTSVDADPTTGFTNVTMDVAATHTISDGMTYTFSNADGSAIVQPANEFSTGPHWRTHLGDNHIDDFPGPALNVDQIEVGQLANIAGFPAGTTVIGVNPAPTTNNGYIGNDVSIVWLSNNYTGTTTTSSTTLTLSTPLEENNLSSTWGKYKSHKSSVDSDDNYWPMDGSRYGLDPQHAQVNGSFYEDCRSGKMHFSSNIAGKTVILDYISDSLGTDGEMQVHKFAEEAMYKCIAHAILSTRANVQEYVINRFKKERFAAVRTAKLRLSNLKLEELTQILRGKSKQIKH
jgi:hypothetical protein